jgi:hypothetical protein
MGEVFFLNRIPLPSYGIQSSLYVDGGPNNHRVGPQIEISCLIGLAFLILLAHNPCACKEEECAEIGELFAFVELSVDASAQGFICEVAQPENRLDEASVLLEKLGELPLARRGLKSAHEERSRPIAAFPRACHTRAIVSFRKQPKEINATHEPGIKARVERGIRGTLVQVPVANVAQARGTLHPP